MCKHRRFYTLILLCLALCLAGCSTTIGYAPTSMDLPTATSVADMEQAADLIVVGRYTEELPSYNKSRDPADPSKENTSTPIIGRIFQFEVSQVIKGNLESRTIQVSIPWSTTREYKPSVRQLGMGEAPISYTYQDPRFVLPQYDTDYLLFLDYSTVSGHHYGAVEPWSVICRSDGSAALCSGLLNVQGPFQLEGSIANSRKTLTVALDMGTVSDFLGSVTFEEICQQASIN